MTKSTKNIIIGLVLLVVVGAISFVSLSGDLFQGKLSGQVPTTGVLVLRSVKDAQAGTVSSKRGSNDTNVSFLTVEARATYENLDALAKGQLNKPASQMLHSKYDVKLDTVAFSVLSDNDSSGLYSVSGEVKEYFSNLALYNGANIVSAKANVDDNGKVVFSGLNMTIKSGDRTAFTLKGDLNNAPSGYRFKLAVLAPADVSAASLTPEGEVPVVISQSNVTSASNNGKYSYDAGSVVVTIQ